MDRDRPHRSGRIFRIRRACRLGLVGVLIASSWASNAARADDAKPAGKSPAPEAVEFFESRVRPILVERCVKCHGPRKQSGGLRLDGRDAILKGGDTGPAVVPDKPEESLIIQAISYRLDELKMPPTKKLPDTDVAFLTRWVALGAPWPADTARNAAVAHTSASAAPAHWAFQPLRTASLPPVKNRGWVRSPIDTYLLARLEAEGIAPSPPADKRALIRRATIDLWGIPPTADEVEAFEARPVAGRLRPGRSTGSWRRRDMASDGVGTGSTSPDTPTPRAMSLPRSAGTPSPSRIATMSSTPSTPIWATTGSSSSSSRPIKSPTTAIPVPWPPWDS